MSNSERQFPVSRPKMVICRPPEDMVSSDDDDEEFVDDELNKTLPANFKFRSRAKHQSSLMHSCSPTGGTPPDLGSPTNRSRALKRGKPVNAAKKPDITKYREFGRSDPFLSQDGSNDEYHENELSESLRTHLRLPPTRTQSLNQPKSPHSPRISSPSPCGSPRTWSPSISNFERFSHGRRSEMRRLSLVSWSSGYTTCTTDSPASLSSYPSQEHIQQEENTADHNQLPTTPTPEDFAKLRKHFRSDSSGSSSIQVDDENQVVRRRRTRSLSPERSPRESLLDLDDTLAIFREKFPRAKKEMELQLAEFLNKFSETNIQFSDSNVNFARHQILGFVRELLYKSQNEIINKDMFIVFSENILHAVTNVRERNGTESLELNQLVRKLYAIISRVARLTEISEFDPNALGSSVLQLSGDGQGEMSDWIQKLSSSHVPYILNRLNQSLENSEEGQVKVSKERPSSLHLSLNQIHPRKEDFEIVTNISNGAYGSVYLVRHKKTRMRFAMKKISKKRMIMKKQVEQVFTERDILTFAENPFVVGLWCTFQTRHHLYLVMEYVEGGDVATVLKNIGCLSLETARLYFAETVLALEYIHSHGIIHRDLKPDNLLVTSMGHIKLTDFGLSKIGLTNYAAHVIEDAWSKDYQFIDKEVYGTPDYIAPEVILGRPYGFPVDWWSMGVILYEMIMGVTPFVSCTVQDLFDEITDENLKVEFSVEDEEDDEEVPEEAQDIILALLCHDPLSRLGSSSYGGAADVKSHRFFDGLDWAHLLRAKAEFIPQLTSDEDTSYFDTRVDRYNPEMLSDEEDGDGELLEQPFENFSSTAPRMSSCLDESFRLSLHEKDANRDSGIVEQESATASILTKNKPIVILHETSEPNETQGDDDDDDDEDDESGQITNIDDANFTTEEDENSRGSVTPSIPLDITHSEEEVPLSPSDTSNDERSATPRTDNSPSSTPPSNLLTTKKMSVTPIVIPRGRNGYGMMLKPIRVYMGDSNNYRMHHIIQSIDKDGPAWKAGLRSNTLVTHINGESITGLQHVEVVSLMLKKDSKKSLKKEKTHLTIHTIPLDQTSIRQDGRKRMPWLGRRLGKLLRKPSNRIRKRPSLFWRMKSSRSVDTTSHSFSTPSPTGSLSSSKYSTSPRRAESMKDRVSRSLRKNPGATPKRKQTPVSPLARSTSPVALSSIITPNSSPPGSTQNLSSTTPPNSPPTGHKERHSMFADSNLLIHKKSISSSESYLSTNKKSSTSPHTSPLLKRAISPSPDQQLLVKNKKSTNLERSTIPRIKKHGTSLI